MKFMHNHHDLCAHTSINYCLGNIINESFLHSICFLIYICDIQYTYSLLAPIPKNHTCLKYLKHILLGESVLLQC
jgi:hypothetical protein